MKPKLEIGCSAKRLSEREDQEKEPEQVSLAGLFNRFRNSC
jgi:hypothetical protein